ncbi:MAG: hypothetical protein K1W26_14390 [Acetatifactor sp.]
MDYKMEELLPIVTKLAQKYAGWESTSITYERAQILMEGVLYCLEEYRNQSPDTLALRDISAEKQYETGAEWVLKKTGCIREMYNELSVSFQDYGVKCLRDTVRLGIPEFLKRYDVKFCPQDTVITLDYPVLTDLSGRRGADAVYHYLRSVFLEQKFLRNFDSGYVREILEKYNPRYGDLYVNICEIALVNIFGHVILHKPLQETGFAEEEYGRLQEHFQTGVLEDTTELLRQIIAETVRTSRNDDAELVEYLCGNAENMATWIMQAAESGRMDRIFLL